MDAIEYEAQIKLLKEMVGEKDFHLFTLMSFIQEQGLVADMNKYIQEKGRGMEFWNPDQGNNG